MVLTQDQPVCDIGEISKRAPSVLNHYSAVQRKGEDSRMIFPKVKCHSKQEIDNILTGAISC